MLLHRFSIQVGIIGLLLAALAVSAPSESGQRTREKDGGSSDLRGPWKATGDWVGDVFLEEERGTYSGEIVGERGGGILLFAKTGQRSYGGFWKESDLFGGIFEFTVSESGREIRGWLRVAPGARRRAGAEGSFRWYRPSEEVDGVRSVLRDVQVDVRFQDESLEKVLAYLASRSGVEIVLSPAVTQDRSESDLEVSIAIAGTSVETILNLLAGLEDLAWYVEGRRVIVTIPEDLQSRDETEPYQMTFPKVPREGFQVYTLSGGKDPRTPIVADDDLSLFLNGVLIFSDEDAIASNDDRFVRWEGTPITFHARPGDRLRIVLVDRVPGEWNLGPLYLHGATGKPVLLVERIGGASAPDVSPSRPTTWFDREFAIESEANRSRYVDDAGATHVYRLVECPGSGMTWMQAKRDAESQYLEGIRGHLATITSIDEDARVRSFVRGTSVRSEIFIGGFQPEPSREPDGNWQWVTGERWTFTDWADGQPDDAFGNGAGEDYLSLWDACDFHWNDIGGDEVKQYYLVEFDDIRDE